MNMEVQSERNNNQLAEAAQKKAQSVINNQMYKSLPPQPEPEVKMITLAEVELPQFYFKKCEAKTISETYAP